MLVIENNSKCKNCTIVNKYDLTKYGYSADIFSVHIHTNGNDIELITSYNMGVK